MDSMAAHNDGYSPRCSCTILAARSRTSSEDLFELLTAQSSQSDEPPQTRGDSTCVVEGTKKHKISEPPVYVLRKHFGQMEQQMANAAAPSGVVYLLQTNAWPK